MNSFWILLLTGVVYTKLTSDMPIGKNQGMSSPTMFKV